MSHMCRTRNCYPKTFPSCKRKMAFALDCRVCPCADWSICYH